MVQRYNFSTDSSHICTKKTSFSPCIVLTPIKSKQDLSMSRWMGLIFLFKHIAYMPT